MPLLGIRPLVATTPPLAIRRLFVTEPVLEALATGTGPVAFVHASPMARANCAQPITGVRTGSANGATVRGQPA